MTKASQQETQMKRSGMRVVLEYVIWIASIVVIHFLLQTFVISSFQINGGSMSPTLEHQQNMVMWKLGSPSRFDVIVVEAPDGAYEYDASGQVKKDHSGNPIKKLYIKRVIGMPGDTLEYRNDVLYINGVAYDEPYLNASRSQRPGAYMANSTLEEYMSYARTVMPDLPAENTRLVEKNGVSVIPEGYYFVLGDNRLESKDSQEYGLAHQRLIKGVVVLRYYPFDKISIAPFMK